MTVWKRLARLFSPSEHNLLVALCLVIGAGTGIATWLFLRLLEAVQFWPAIAGESRLLGLTVNRFWIVAIPGLGGLLCGLVIQYGDHAAKATGTPEIIYSLARNGGRLPLRYTILKALASIFTVCSGGSAGPEAPMVSVGAGLGSSFGARLLKNLDGDSLRILSAAGAASGFAAVFNAPISGVLFAVEVLLKDLTARAFTLIMLATFTASVTTRYLMGNRVFVSVPPSFSFNSLSELWFYLLLALLAAAVSKIFGSVYLALEHEFKDWKSPQAVKTMAGGLLVGLMALYLPEAMGNGHLVIPRLIEAELTNPKPWMFLLLLLGGKILACSLTVGSGGSGGIFIPYLLMGAAVGGLVGRVSHSVLPMAAPSGAYMIVGMSAVFAGITYAPFTAIILLFELTGDYNIILPAMFTVGIAVTAAHAFDSESLEAKKLLKKGLRLHEPLELRVLENYCAKDVMNRDVKTIPEGMLLSNLMDFVAAHPHTGYPVVDASGLPTGLLIYHDYRDLHKALQKGTHAGGATVKDIMRRHFPAAHPDDSLVEVVRHLQKQHADRVLVLDPENGSLLGLVTKSDVLRIHWKLLS